MKNESVPTRTAPACRNSGIRVSDQLAEGARAFAAPQLIRAAEFRCGPIAVAERHLTPLFFLELRARACLGIPLVRYAIRLAGETTWPTPFRPRLHGKRHPFLQDLLTFRGRMNRARYWGRF